MKSLLILLACLVAFTQAKEGYWLQFTARSVKSDLFLPLRVNKTQVMIDKCDKKVTETYGILSQRYEKVGAVAAGEKCTWYLHAPNNSIVNIISISFILKDEIQPARSDDYKVSKISIYDGVKPDQENLLTTYHVTPQEKVGYFIQSFSSKEDMVVEINYHDNKDFASQSMLINYEFLDVDQMNAILRGSKE